MNRLNTVKNLEFYNKNGYLIVEDFFSKEEIDELKESAHQIAENFDVETLSVFTTEKQSQHTNRYFIDSANEVSCFFEPEALNHKGELTREKHLAINKIGHAMHDLIPSWQKISYRRSLYDFAKSIGQEEPAIVQSQYIYKQPHIGGQVHAHTDSTFIHTKPLSCLGAWVALEDANKDNGCLLAIPGSHEWPLQNLFVRSEKENETEMIGTENEVVSWEEEHMIPLEVKKGTLVLLHGSLVHASNPNNSHCSRHAFVLHLVDLDAEWSDKNWLQRSEEIPFRKMRTELGERS